MANQMPMLTLSGVPELQQLMRDLGPRMLGEGVKAMRKAMQPIVKDAKRRITIGWGYGSGQLKRSLGILYGKVFKDRKRAVVKIGPRQGFNQATKVDRSFDGSNRKGRVRIRHPKGGHDPRMIAHLVEFGHRIAVGGKLDRHQGSRRRGNLQLVVGSGTERGRVKPMPFLRPAFDTHRSQALATLTEELRKSLEKIRAKQAARRFAA